MECADPVLIHFEDAQGGATQPFGPFTKAAFFDGVFHSNDRLFAKFIEETQLWHCYPTENFWPVLVIEAATRKT